MQIHGQMEYERWEPILMYEKDFSRQRVLSDTIRQNSLVK